jgi:hypothetical protein
MSSEKSGDSNDGLNGEIKQEPDLQSSQSVYTDLQKALPGGTIMPGIDMQNSNNTHNSHQHPVVSMNNGSSHQHHSHDLSTRHYELTFLNDGDRMSPNISITIHL